jgi:hypothetical protein
LKVEVRSVLFLPYGVLSSRKIPQRQLAGKGFSSGARTFTHTSSHGAPRPHAVLAAGRAACLCGGRLAKLGTVQRTVAGPRGGTTGSSRWMARALGLEESAFRSRTREQRSPRAFVRKPEARGHAPTGPSTTGASSSAKMVPSDRRPLVQARTSAAGWWRRNRRLWCRWVRHDRHL